MCGFLVKSKPNIKPIWKDDVKISLNPSSNGIFDFDQPKSALCLLYFAITDDMFIGVYLPIQNLLKIVPKISVSISIWPVMCPNWRMASRMSMAMKSAVVWPSKPDWARSRAAAVSWRAVWWRALETMVSSWMLKSPRTSLTNFSLRSVMPVPVRALIWRSIWVGPLGDVEASRSALFWTSKMC